MEPHGYLPNDLYDERDSLVDQLSQHVNIKVEKVGSGGNALAIAEGQYKITLVNADGSEGANLVEKADFKQLGFEDTSGKMSHDTPDSISDGSIQLFDGDGKKLNVTLPLLDSNNNLAFSQGSLRGLIESYGYNAGGTTKGTFPEMLDDLDKMAFTFAALFNEVHGKGYNLEGKEPTDDKKNFFELGTNTGEDYKNFASEIKLNSNLEAKDILASSAADNSGDGKNAVNLANIQSFILSNGKITLEGGKEVDVTAMKLPIDSGTIKSFYEGIIGRLGVDAQEANRLTKNSGVLLMSVEKNRQSVSSVSLDEEMTDMIRFQHAYNAAARNITVVDEMLDKIINGMGTVGR
jgi:flagellar hook-associated protein 1 FlgK